MTVLVLGIGVTLLVLGVVHGWLVLAVTGVVFAHFGPVLVARRVPVFVSSSLVLGLALIGEVPIPSSPGSVLVTQSAQMSPRPTAGR